MMVKPLAVEQGGEPLPPEWFQRLPPEHPAEQPGRLPTSFWTQARQRLQRDPRAWFGGIVAVLMVAAALFGPWLWPRDPALQNPTRASLGPAAALEVRLVVPDAPWQPPKQLALATEPPVPAAALGAVSGLAVVEAHTEWVRLRWDPVPGARRYHVYRHAHPPRDREDLGLPLGATLSPEDVGFEDRLRLRPHSWYYSIVASDGMEESPHYSVLEVKPEPALLLLTAQLLQHVPADADPEQWAGRSITLSGHPLGTDYLGRDLLARLLQGARTSLFIGIAAPLSFVLFGALYGAIAGLAGGWVDGVLMRVADFVVALPFLLFMILLRVAFGIGPGESGIGPLVIAMVVLSWPASARLVRGQVLQLREEPFIDAARLAGASRLHLISRHVLPSIVGVVLVALTFAIPSAIFTEAFLSFIGMGVTPPTASWGSMSNDGMRTLLTEPHELLAPAACISLAVLSFNLLGDALRDALDTRLEVPL